MAFSKVKVGGLADDSVTAANIDDDGTGYTVGNLTNSGTLQQTGQVTLGSGGTNWSLPTARGTDKYVLQINGTTGASTWAESLTAPEISGHNFDVSGSTDDGGINAYEAPYELTGTTNETTTISAITTTNLLVGQYISGAGIPANTTISSISSAGSSNNGTIVISNAVTVAGTQTNVALKIQKTPGEKNGGKVTLTGTNFGATIGEISVAITNSAGVVIANASYLSGLSGGTTITAEWTGTEGSYSTDLTSSYTDPIYFKMTKSGLSSNVHNTNTTLTSDPAVTALSGSSQTGGDVFTDPSATSLGAYGSGRIAGGGGDSNTKLLLNFDRTGGTDIEDSSNVGGDGHKVTASGNAVIKSSPFGDGKSAMFFDGSDDKLTIADSDDWDFGTGDFTVEFWTKQNRDGSNGGAFVSSKASWGSGAGWSVKYDMTSGNLGYQYGSTDYISTSNVNDDSWHHIAWVKNGDNLNLYLDGISINTATGLNSTSFPDESNGITIGSLTGGANLIKGYMDEIRIVKGVAVYTSDFTVPTSRLSATQSNQGTNIADITGTATKLLIHSDKGGSDVFYGGGEGVARTYSITTANIPEHSSYNDENNLINGTNVNNYYFSPGTTVTNSMTMTFDLGAGKSEVFNRFTWIQNTNDSHGTWKIQGSNDNFSTPVDLLSSFTFGGATQSHTDFTNTNAYRYYRLIGISGTTSSNPWLYDASWSNKTFTDSSTSNHTITPTGSYHSQAHGGIAPAMTWPASLKKTGSAGVYFDGNGDKLTGGTSPVLSTGNFAIDFWCWPSSYQLTTGAVAYVFDGRADGSNIQSLSLQLVKSSLQLKVFDHVASSWAIDNASDTALTGNTWNHIQLNRSSGTLKLYINGVASSNTNTTNSNFSEADGFTIGTDYSGGNPFTGYIDNFRISVGTARETSNFSSSLPTKVYGAFGPDTPDVGTITLTATGDGDFTWSEVAAGTALPGTLAVGSTTHSGSGNSRTHTATITGKLPTNTSTTYTNGARGDTATNNILLKVQHDTDATKAVTLNGTTGMGITQKSTEKPVLFNARRYHGNLSDRTINGFGFSPDFVWIKNRDNSSGYHHALYDTVRGANKTLKSSDGGAETTQTDQLNSFLSDGFSLGDNSDSGNYVNLDDTYIAWAWKAGGAPSAYGKKKINGVESDIDSNDYNNLHAVDDASHGMKQSINTTGGFSITKFSVGGTSGYGWFKHGFSGDPDWVIIRRIDDTYNWDTWHSGLTTSWNTNQTLKLNTSDSLVSGRGNIFRDGSGGGFPKNDGKIYIDRGAIYGGDADDEFICYAWKAVPGVSAFGTYNGDGSNAVTVSNIGFKPRFLMVKSISGTLSWHIVDSFRFGGDTGNQHLYADVSQAELNTASHATTFFSNNGGGFTLTGTSSHMNGANNTYIYMAYA